MSKDDPEITRLSEALNALPVHPASDHLDKFRNPNGVYMKLCNFLRFDPDYRGSGLQRGGRLEEEVWAEFANDPVRLRATAASIVAAIPEVAPPASHEDFNADVEEEFSEGRVLTQLHRKRERSGTAPRRKKEKVLQTLGCLACEVCGFDFFAVYGELGQGFAECHHRKALCDLEAGVNTRLSDLAIVCSNCHRMLHRARPWLTVEELAEIVRG